MRILLIGVIVVSQSVAMQQSYSPDSLFKAVEKKDQKKVLTIILKKTATREESKTLPLLLEWQSYPQRRTPLLQATIDNNIESAEMLIEAGANIFANDLTGVNSFSRAFSHSQLDLLKVFMQTDLQRQKDKMELLILNKLRFVSTNAQPAKHLVNLVGYLFTTDKVHVSQYKWLTELAEASKQVGINQTNGFEYVRIAPIYKQIALHIFKHYEYHRNALIRKFETNNYLNALPVDLRHVVVDFLLQGSHSIHLKHWQTIQEMPES
jgi:hypothetical protein